MDAVHPQREVQQPKQRSPDLADDQKQSSPSPQCQQSSAAQPTEERHEKAKLWEINSYLTCHLCKGYMIDATTISECLHSFCRSCIIKFLEDNSFCPVCEVIINKAKPNLKLDKTLQDIIYKLVPGLFLAEMLRRKRFYAERPGEAERVSPEQRGEDTERTIFNPQDRISLSLEYIGDAATSGRILKDLKTTLEKQKVESGSKTGQSEDALLKRYLECPGMCRIDVIKRFIKNKYNVNTDLFQIDILYKRVPLPLPDHYTLIDIAYIYTWKRNEQMQFYFRIIDKGNDELPDLTKVFTPIDAPPLPRPQFRSTPTKKSSKVCSTPEKKEKKKKTPKKRLPPSKLTKKEDCNNCDNKLIKTECDGEVGAEKTSDKQSDVLVNKVVEKSDSCEPVDDVSDVKSDVAEEVEVKKEVYTNITLNRTNNVEIITKIHKVSDKGGQQIGVNIVNQTVKKNGCALSEAEVKKEIPVSEPEVKQELPTKVKEEVVLPVVKQEVEECTATISSGLTEDEMEQKKFEFLKSIELTSKKVVDNLAKLMQKQQQVKALSCSTQQIKASGSTKPCYALKAPIPNATMEIVKPKKSNATKAGSNGLKRKISSPAKSEAKKAKVEPKRTTKIILQQKPGYPTVNPAKPNDNKNDLHSLFQNCRLNIPSSLSITLKENGETSRKPLQMPPVQNFIEILKIDEKEGKKTVTVKLEEPSKNLAEIKNLTEIDSKPVECSDNKSTKTSEIMNPQQKVTSNDLGESASRLNKTNLQHQSFQKIFEESIKKTENETSPGDVLNGSGKRKILEIAQQLYKKTKTELDSKKEQVKPEVPAFRAVAPKIQIPRLSNQRVVKPPKRSQKYESVPHQTLKNLHSSSLGLNYTVSVGKQSREPVQQTYTVNGILTSSNPVELSSNKEPVSTGSVGNVAPKPSPVSPKTLNSKQSSSRSPVKNSKVPHSPRPNIASPAPRTEMSSPKNYAPRNYSAKTPQSSPKPRSSSASPKLAQSAGSSSSSMSSSPPTLTPNQLLEKYNIQNLAQLSASMNFNTAASQQSYLSTMQGNQMAALHQAMLMKQFEMQNRQKWLNINQGPLLQFEKYLQSLNASKNQILGNIKDN